MSEPKLSVFLCHSSHDKSMVRELYRQLLNESWIDPWLDEEKLLPGQDWDFEIERAVEKANAVIICLSRNSVTKEGYIQRELKFVLDIALEKPEGTIFIIPLRLDDCELPRRLRSWQYVDYFPQDHRKRAHQRLIQSLHARYGQMLADKDAAEIADAFKAAPIITSGSEAPPPNTKNTDRLMVSLPTTTPGVLELIGSLLPILFFAQLVPIMFGEYTDASWLLLGITAILNAVFLIFTRELVLNRWIILSMTLFLAAHSLMVYGEYRGWPIIVILKPIAGLLALLVGGLYVVNFKSPRKSAPYAAILVAAYLALYGAKVVLSVMQIPTDGIHNLVIVNALIGAIFLWLER